jgi:hypothetical protein
MYKYAQRALGGRSRALGAARAAGAGDGVATGVFTRVVRLITLAMKIWSFVFFWIQYQHERISPYLSI